MLNLQMISFLCVRYYEPASGIKINFHKSMLLDLNVDRNTCDCYAKTLYCAQMVRIDG